jgi:hypothetical protein
MKKIALLSVALMASSGAFAADPLTSGPNDYRMTSCSLLANDIRLILTENVVGAVNCDETNNFVALSTCHSSGSTNTRSRVVTKDESGAVICTVTESETCIQEVSGSQYPSATTVDGTVSSVFPGSNCAADTVGAVADSFSPETDAGA